MRLLTLVLFLLIPNPQTIVPKPHDDSSQHWKGCVDMPESMLPISPEDDFDYHLCTDIKDKMWEVAHRNIEGSNQCQEVVPADKHDDYQHFDCTMKYELLIRPLPKTTPK